MTQLKQNISVFEQNISVLKQNISVFDAFTKQTD